MEINYKKMLILIISLISLIIIYKLPKLLIYKNNEALPEVKLKARIKKEKLFAIMISEDGNNYQKYDGSEWPGEIYKFKEAKCIDNKGNLIDNAVSFESATNTIILETDKTLSCTLYFNHKETIEILRDNDVNGNISPEPNQGGMYRYQGTDNVANWICFGTTDNCSVNDESIDEYMYRIIGITSNGELYLLKETTLKEENISLFAWNDRYYLESSDYRYCENGICPEWPDSKLFKRLNGTSNGTIKGTGHSDNANTDIFVDSTQYDYLKSGNSINGTKDDKGSKWYQLIVNHDWLYGDTNIRDDSIMYDGNKIYEIESGLTSTTHYVGTQDNITQDTYKWNEETDPVTAKISLLYINDVAYAYYDGNDPDTRGNPGSSTNVKNSWIHFRKDGYNTSENAEWLSTRFGPLSTAYFRTTARRCVYDGELTGYNDLWDALITRPVFYLSSKAKISSGSGTKTDPFILEI